MNPLSYLKMSLPLFDKIKPEDVTLLLNQLIQENTKQLENLLKQATFTWDNLIEPLEILENELSLVWNTVSHLHAVDMEVWRDVYQDNLPKLIEHETRFFQNRNLYEAYKKISVSKEFENFSCERKKIIEDALRDFELTGVHLPEEEKKEYAELQKNIGLLSHHFEENVAEATHAWVYYTESEADLAGLPVHTVSLARENAKTKNQSGWLFTLDFPIYFSILSCSERRDLREKFYEAYVTRASEKGPFAERWDNTGLIKEILSKRYRMAKILNFENYAQMSLQTKMLKEPKKVLDFLNSVLLDVKAVSKKEIEILKDFSRKKDGIELQAWDVAYYREKLKSEKYHITDEALRPYFPLKKVIAGLFQIVYRLYDVRIDEEPTSVWHPLVKCYVLKNNHNEVLGYVYFDLFTRVEKREGAWLAAGRSRMNIGTPKKKQIPMAYLNCNFDPPLPSKDTFLTHEEVLTLFHEFGHGLEHLLTRADYPSLSGSDGMPWDVVEVASQLFENWCWEKEALDFISDSLPSDLYTRMLACRYFCSGMDLVRQLEFSLFDFELHCNDESNKKININDFYKERRERCADISIPDYNRFPLSFSHIFSGGYAAGYYGYLWAEVLSSDIFLKFKEEGIFNKVVAKRYLDLILSCASACDFMQAFIQFRGREPDINAFLHFRGIKG
ncbi:MAG: hypothetical protein ACD_44C00112G0002 [uncultured bacterium]|nr:MAG: hypothetical protein ACD_44C00112G0002 [uncultured bacterium]